ADLIVDALRHWAIDMGVDGFRFDLASIMSRGQHGEVLTSPSVLERISHDPVLSGCKLIAEPWDAAGLYQVGQFGHQWVEWNDQFRNDIRRFVRSEPGLVPALAARVGGSRDIFGGANRSVNFVTCHDGYTLNDLVSYQGKHNLANGEDNRDGTNENFSWNCGEEGPSQDPTVRALRARQAKNHLVLLLLSAGVPMLLAGDERRHTQFGNNNAYCQDNALTWLNWSWDLESRSLLELIKTLVKVRKSPVFDGFFRSSSDVISIFRTFESVDDWRGAEFGMVLELQRRDDRALLLVNNHWEPRLVQLPESDTAWVYVFDTADASHISSEAEPPTTVAGDLTEYHVESRSIALVVNRDYELSA
ncbi:MAG: glycogen debranching enzyme, partial [Pseudomonadota bacterium]